MTPLLETFQLFQVLFVLAWLVVSCGLILWGLHKLGETFGKIGRRKVLLGVLSLLVLPFFSAALYKSDAVAPTQTSLAPTVPNYEIPDASPPAAERDANVENYNEFRARVPGLKESESK